MGELKQEEVNMQQQTQAETKKISLYLKRPELWDELEKLMALGSTALSSNGCLRCELKRSHLNNKKKRFCDIQRAKKNRESRS